MKNRSMIAAALFGTVYALWLSTEDGKAWADENTTLSAVVGIGGVLAALRLDVSPDAWQRVAYTFLASGVPLMVRGVVRKLN